MQQCTPTTPIRIHVHRQAPCSAALAQLASQVLRSLPDMRLFRAPLTPGAVCRRPMSMAHVSRVLRRTPPAAVTRIATAALRTTPAAGKPVRSCSLPLTAQEGSDRARLGWQGVPGRRLWAPGRAGSPGSRSGARPRWAGLRSAGPKHCGPPKLAPGKCCRGGGADPRGLGRAARARVIREVSPGRVCRGLGRRPSAAAPPTAS